MHSLLTLLPRDSDSTPPTCDVGNEYDGRMGLRISSIFVILVSSLIGAVFPIIAHHFRGLGVPSWAFFVAKFFGSGVILATAFIHLLAEGSEALNNECLTGPITEYDWAEGIAIMTIGVMFFVELMVMRYARFGNDHTPEIQGNRIDESGGKSDTTNRANIPGEDHFGHVREHRDPELAKHPSEAEEYSAQLTAVFILEFGILFHSVFVGLTLAVEGEDFITLYIVLVFHQLFEGLGLGSRLATTPWPRSKRFTPYLLGLAFALSTPIAIAIGLGVRKSYATDGRTNLITSGVFDSISAGILIYTSLVELMAHEFIFSPYMRRAPITKVLAAFGLLCLGGLLMALLGKWA